MLFLLQNLHTKEIISMKKYFVPLSILACLLFAQMAIGQSDKTKISGRVLESNGEPVFGATVILQNTSTGTVTEADGSFELIGELRGEYILQASYMGYITVLRKLALEPGKSYTVNISMEEDNVKL